MIKEGSIGYLLIKMPWSGQGCQVEVNGLELVISPCTDKIPTGGDETLVFDDNDNHHLKYSSTRTEQDVIDDTLKSSLMDVHEGVKTIAKMVKWLLTSFHVKIENVIVAYDPSLDKNDKKTECHRTLVLRISEIECGTCLSEDSDSSADVLGISRLTNFVRFQGAILELLNIDEDDASESSPEGYREPFLGSNKVTCPVMTGKKDGFNVSVDPIVLRFQPSTVKWLLCAWKSYKNLEKNGGVCMSQDSRGSVQLKSTYHSSNSVSVTCGSNESITGHGTSGMWNWTCSVFSAITATSSLASGSLPTASGT
ncbi:Autophagy-related protein 2 [Senna tora]|uniref:Autophagy-related protein 2 n=1 Tax=Senna tora TaxID=362788 RepID=A0A835CFH6_9FABA|nr:Autophagy-related protein 2 [Senna tora]